VGKDGGIYRRIAGKFWEEYWRDQRVRMEEHTGGTTGKFWEKYWRDQRVRMEEHTGGITGKFWGKYWRGHILGEQLVSFGSNTGGISG
jgi:hypothetical protein